MDGSDETRQHQPTWFWSSQPMMQPRPNRPPLHILPSPKPTRKPTSSSGRGQAGIRPLQSASDRLVSFCPQDAAATDMELGAHTTVRSSGYLPAAWSQTFYSPPLLSSPLFFSSFPPLVSLHLTMGTYFQVSAPALSWFE